MNDGFLTKREREIVAEFKDKINQGLWARKEITHDGPFYL
jgi:hypothetical protein